MNRNGPIGNEASEYIGVRTLTAPLAPFLRDGLSSDFIVATLDRIAVRAAAGAKRFGDAAFDHLARRALGGAAILVVGKAFGGGDDLACAAARLRESGVRVVLAESFAPGFSVAAAEAGLWAIELPRATLQALVDENADGEAVTVDATTATITCSSGAAYPCASPAAFAPDQDGEHVLIAPHGDVSI
ncbi:MAG: hypothetical protein AAGJ87_07955 [Pseudomonadota bacterium]